MDCRGSFEWSVAGRSRVAAALCLLLLPIACRIPEPPVLKREPLVILYDTAKEPAGLLIFASGYTGNLSPNTILWPSGVTTANSRMPQGLSASLCQISTPFLTVSS